MMSKSVKKPLKHKLNDAQDTGSTAKKIRVSSRAPGTSSKDDSGIGPSVSGKKKCMTRKKSKSDSKVTAKRCLNPVDMDVSAMDVSQLLAVGEGAGEALLEKPLNTQMSDSSGSESEDWEEVTENAAGKEPVIPKEGVDITLDAPMISFKRKKKEQDLHDEIRRQLKRRQKEIQELMHKVHLLSWIAHIKYVNSILNSETLLAMSISLTTSKSLYPPKRADCNYLERVVNWFGKTIVVAVEVKKSERDLGLLQELTIQFETKTAFSKRHLVFMFVVFLRSLGLQCRLITSIVCVPLKPGGEKGVSNFNKKLKICEGEISKSVAQSYESVVKSPKREPSTEELDLSAPSKTKNPPVSKPPVQNKESKSKNSSTTTTAKNKIKKEPVDSKKTSGPGAKNKPCTPPSKEPVKAETRQLRSRKAIKVPTPENDKVPEKSKTTRSKKNVESEDSDDEFSKYFKNNSKKGGVGSSSSKMKSKAPDIKPSTSKAALQIKAEDSDDDFSPPKITKNKLDRRVLSSDDDGSNAGKKKEGLDFWVEVFLEAEEKWITVDVIKKKIHCTRQLSARATQPVVYVIACNNNSTLKDVTKRYVLNWHSDTRKRRVAESWWQETLWPYLPPVTAQDREEDEDIARQLQDMPLPTSIAEYKFHPLYALKRHLLKFEAIYPPDAPPLGYMRKEPVYARECVVTLRSRDIWYKEARVVRRNETPYKIVKSRPKYDKMTGEWRKDLPLEVFGIWQTEDFMPPIAVDGKVPRNEYGNVDLFKACMLPIGTVHIQVPALNRVAKKLGIDCAPAIVGFEFHSGGCHPVHDGFVVCEEFKDKLLDAWNKEIDESAKRNEEKREKRVFGNWRRLIRGLFIRERLKIKYSFNENPENGASTSTQYLKIQKGAEESD